MADLQTLVQEYLDDLVDRGDESGLQCAVPSTATTSRGTHSSASADPSEESWTLGPRFWPSLTAEDGAVS